MGGVPSDRLARSRQQSLGRCRGLIPRGGAQRSPHAFAAAQCRPKASALSLALRSANCRSRARDFPGRPSPRSLLPISVTVCLVDLPPVVDRQLVRHNQPCYPRDDSDLLALQSIRNASTANVGDALALSEGRHPRRRQGFATAHPRLCRIQRAYLYKALALLHIADVHKTPDICFESVFSLPEHPGLELRPRTTAPRLTDRLLWRSDASRLFRLLTLTQM
jgi:hypothetical protein